MKVSVFTNDYGELKLSNVFTALADQYLQNGKAIGFSSSGILTPYNSGYIGKLLFENITQKLYIGGSGSWKQLCKYSELTQTSGFLQSGYIAADLALSGTLTTSIASASGTLNTKIDNVSGALYNQIWASGSIVTAIDTASGAAVTNAVGQAQTIITNASGVLNTKIDNTSGTLNNKIWASGSIVTAIANASGAAVTTANTNTTNVSGALYNQIWASGSIVTAIANASGAAVLTASGIADQLYAPKVVYGSGLPSPGISGLFFMDHSDALYPDYFGPTLYIGIAGSGDPYEREWLEIVDSTKLARELDSALSYYASITLLNSTSGYLESYTNSTVNIVLNASKAYTDNKILNLNMLASGLSMVMGPVYKPNQIKPLFVTAQYENIVSSTNGVISVGGGNSAYPAWQLIGENYNIPTSNWYLRSGQDETWGTPYRIWHSGDFSQTNVNTWNGLQTVITNASGTLNTKIDNASGTLNTKIDNVSGALKAQIWTSGSIVTAIASASGAAVVTASGIANGLYVKKSGDTMAGDLIYRNTVGYPGITSVTTAPIHSQNTAISGSGWFAPFIHDTTSITDYGYRKHVAIGTYRNGIAWGGGIFFAQGATNDNYPSQYFLMDTDGNLLHSGGGYVSTFYNTANVSALSGSIVTTASGIANNLYLKKDGSTSLTGTWYAGNGYIISSGSLALGPIGGAAVERLEIAGRPKIYQQLNSVTRGFIAYGSGTANNTYIGLGVLSSGIAGIQTAAAAGYTTLALSPLGGNVTIGYNGTGVSALDVSGVVTATGGNSTNWNAAYSWGNHAGLYRPIAWVPAWGDITDKPTTYAPSAHNHSKLSVGAGDSIYDLWYESSFGAYITRSNLVLGNTAGGSTALRLMRYEVPLTDTSLGIISWGWNDVEYTPAVSTYIRSKCSLGNTNGIMEFGLVDNVGTLHTDNMVLVGSTGRVGIGKNNPATTLDVNGIITALGGNSTNWNAAYNASRQTSVFYPFPKGLTDYAATFASGTYGRVMFSVPSDFISLNSLKLICVPLVTASGNRRVRIDFLYGKPGESFTQHESSEYRTIDFGLDNIKQSIELSGYLPASLEALDTGYVFIGHMTDGAIPPPTGVTHYYGIELNYNKY